MNHKIPFNYCIQTKIFEFLCLKDLLVCRLVCKKWKLFISYFPLKYVMNDNNNIGNIFNGIAYIKFNELFHHIDLKCINCNKLKSLHIRNISTNTVQTIQTIQFPWLTKLEIYFSTCSSLNLNEFQSLKKLKLFDLSQLTDTNFKCTTPPLKQLKISTTPNLNLQFLQNISLYLKQIKLFNMNQIHFNNLQYLQQFQLLTILEISNNDSIIDDDLIQHLPPLHLNELTLSDCNGLHGYFLKTLQSIQHLKLTFDRFLENDCLLLYQWNNSLKTLDIF
ncbi:F-box/leucine rich repeat protein [Entamoeba marina]